MRRRRAHDASPGWRRRPIRRPRGDGPARDGRFRHAAGAATKRPAGAILAQPRRPLVPPRVKRIGAASAPARRSAWWTALVIEQGRTMRSPNGCSSGVPCSRARQGIVAVRTSRVDDDDGLGEQLKNPRSPRAFAGTERIRHRVFEPATTNALMAALRGSTTCVATPRPQNRCGRSRIRSSCSWTTPATAGCGPAPTGHALSATAGGGAGLALRLAGPGRRALNDNRRIPLDEPHAARPGPVKDTTMSEGFTGRLHRGQASPRGSINRQLPRRWRGWRRPSCACTRSRSASCRSRPRRRLGPVRAYKRPRRRRRGADRHPGVQPLDPIAVAEERARLSEPSARRQQLRPQADRDHRHVARRAGYGGSAAAPCARCSTCSTRT